MGFLDSLKRLLVEEEESTPEEVEFSAEDFEEYKPRHLSEEEFYEVIQEGVTLVDFWAEWCVPCHAVAPAVEELARNYGDQAVIAKLNVDDYPSVAANLGIMGIPSLIVFKDGQEFKRFIGVQAYGALAAAIEAALSS